MEYYLALFILVYLTLYSVIELAQNTLYRKDILKTIRKHVKKSIISKCGLPSNVKAKNNTKIFLASLLGSPSQGTN